MNCLLRWNQYQSLPLWNWSRLRGAGHDRLDGGAGADIITRDADDIVVEDSQDIVIAELNAAFASSDNWMDEV